FFSSRRRHTRCLSDWSSDVCSSDLLVKKRLPGGKIRVAGQRQPHPIRRIDERRIGLSRGVEPGIARCGRGGSLIQCRRAQTETRSEERRVGKERRVGEERAK